MLPVPSSSELAPNKYVSQVALLALPTCNASNVTTMDAPAPPPEPAPAPLAPVPIPLLGSLRGIAGVQQDN
ncbi:hypothetical protein FRC07_000840 [Ceratobasidium sp. 392]|nr:hypothetical protein FRC07_000840 [Ceratobasidium sp. 392]